MIAIENVSFSYGEKSILRHVSFAVENKGIVVITGKNGSGKSTLALLLSGMLTPQNGMVIINGIACTDYEGFETAKRDIGIVFENPENQFITTSVERELAFGLENHCVRNKQMRSRVEETIKQFSLEDIRYRSPHTLSGGEKQKVAIASIMILQPQFLILDEPTIFLDPSSRGMIRELIRELRKTVSIIFISQFPSDILLGDKVYVLGDGTLTGPVDKKDMTETEMYQTPQMKFLDILQNSGFYHGKDIPRVESLCKLIVDSKKQ
ncbi:MAG: ABC transporter ATP-binding protein [Candidatus Cloacimonadota bacterium]|nr:MAG: ABC transporter ATP-binding protein [Candidatus Cloacimonadota bacterium]